MSRPLTEGQVRIAKAMKEATLQEHLRQRCTKGPLQKRLLYYHTHRSTYSPAGYPDTTIVGPTGLLFAELKRVGKKPTPEQQRWIDALRGAAVAVYVWTPEHLLSGEIDAVLADLAAGEPPLATTRH